MITHLNRLLNTRMKSILILFAFVLSLFFTYHVNAEEQTLDNMEWTLTAEQWDLVKNGEQLLKLPVIHDVVNAWLLKPEDNIELRYPGGEEGELWIEELMDWLISLGIASKYMVAVPGSGEADIVIFKLVKVGEL